MADIVSVAYVVDASLALASEWHQVLAEYLLPLLQRLAETHATPQFRLGVVSYGPAETRPTPLLGRHFFAPPQAMMKELREKPEVMGVGLTSSGEPTGMAALEGLVAAVEFFDMYGDALSTMTSHIIHIAAAPPDGSDHPVWNTASTFDNVSWGSLPGELKKRNIHYSNILLKPLACFAQLYTSTSAGPAQQPWFPVRPQHVLHLTGFPQKGAKRPPEGTTTAVRPAEHKRPKTEAHSSPPQQPLSSSPPLSHASPPATTQPQTQPQTHVPTQPPRPVPTLSAHPRDYLLQLQAHILKKKQETQEHTKMGRTKEAEASQQELSKLLLLFQKTQIHLARQGGRTVPASQSQPVGLNNGGGLRPGSGSGPDNGSAGATTMQASTSMPNDSVASNNTNTQAEAQPDRSGQPPHPEPTPIAPSAGPISLGQGSAAVLAVNVPPPELPQSSPGMSKAQASRVPGPEYTRVWEGSITWVDPATLRQLHANAAINGPEMMRKFVWPSTLTLEASPEYRVNMQKLQDWLKYHASSCQVVFAQLHGPPNDPKQHEHVWQSIMSSHRYPIVSFPDTSGVPVNRLLFFPVRPMQFVGAFFTSPSGIPARPPLVIGGIAMQGVPANLVNLLLTLSPQQVSELEKLDHTRKQAKIQEFLQGYRLKAEQQRLLMLKQAQAQAQQNHPGQASQTMSQPQGAIPGNANGGGMVAPSTMVTQSPMQQQQPGIPSQQRVSVAPNNLNTMIPMNPFVNGQPPTIVQMLALGGSQPQGGPQGLNRIPSGPNPMAGLPNGMGMQAMHQHIPSSGGGMNVNGGVNLSQEMMQSFMQRRQDGSGGMGGMGGGMGM